jgi:hypothetical protein
VLPDGDTPGLLAFGSDDFMAELEASLAAQPPTTAVNVAGPEHWSDTQPPLFPVPSRPAPPEQADLKLYQPAHGRFYLVAAHLCCRRYGFPDRRLSDCESVGFVLRRVEAVGTAPVDGDDPATFTELAWVTTDGGSWQRVSERHVLAVGEEMLPLVPTVHTVGERRSRLLTGLVPVGARERYEARGRAVVAQTSTRTGGDTLANPHRGLLDGSVIEAFRQLAAWPATAPPSDSDRKEMFRWALLDLLDFIKQVAGEDPAAMADARLGALAQAPELSWATILKAAWNERPALHKGEPLSEELAGYVDAVTELDFGALAEALVEYGEDLDDPEVPSQPSPPVADPDPVRGLLYVARCVYQRADCKLPRSEWVSPPTRTFRFASFFDPDAPARPVQISLPIDTSQQGLRAFPRNVSVLVSKQLRAQIQQVKGIDKIEEKGQPFDLGMLCSLSIPIITICALILLMIIVSILNLVFFWLPTFKTCLPKPGGGG